MKQRFFDSLLIIISIIIVYVSLKHGTISHTFLGIYLLSLNIYITFKCRKNKGLFLLSMGISYFNYSFIIARYIGTPSEMLADLYAAIQYESTMTISICIMILFFSIINLLMNNRKIIADGEAHSVVSFPTRKILVCFLDVLLVLILSYHLYNKITEPTTLLEYSLIIFIFALYFSKDHRVERIITEIILFSFVFYSIRNGDRIAVLQILIADFIINYIHKFDVKQIAFALFGGIFLFTIFGIYGDYLDAGADIENANIKHTFEVLKQRRFAIDTSVAAYQSGLSIEESSRYFTEEFRFNNFITYFTKYTFLGGDSGYTNVGVFVKPYCYNNGGGFLPMYFYFWIGWYGVILISIIVSWYLNFLISKENNSKNLLYRNTLKIFLISTFPRWYLYAPDLLFRGVLIFSIVYFMIRIFFKATEIENEKGCEE